MSQSVQAFAIGNTSVRQFGGLFSLNDLHSAAGGEAKHKPSEWLRNQQTKDLVGEISKAGIPAFETKRGNGAGIFACRELVIAYAAWISAAFHLKVIRVFLNVQPTTLTPTQKQTLHELVDIVVNSGKQTHAETWARLHRKFHVNSYHQLPADQFDSACQYLRGKLDEGTIADLVRKHLAPAAALHAPTGIERLLITKDLATGTTTVDTLSDEALFFHSPRHMARAIQRCELGTAITKDIAASAMMGMVSDTIALHKQTRAAALTETLAMLQRLPAADLAELATQAHLQLSSLMLEAA